MCTGDNIDTAMAISKNANILSSKDVKEDGEYYQYSCMTGKDFRDLTGGIKTQQ